MTATKDTKEGTALSAAAAALDHELKKFEELVLAANKVPLTTEKNLGRAARAMSDAAEGHDRVAQAVRVLVTAITSARERQQVHADTIQARAEEIKERTQQYEELLRRFGGLGEEAAKLNASVQQVALQRSEAKTPADNEAVVAQLAEIHRSMGELADKAGALQQASNDVEIEDVARQAESLRAQLLAARNKLSLLQQSLEAMKASTG